MTEELVSVVIPTYNRKKVGETVKTVINQTYENLEIIVVDDCSETPAKKRLEDIEDDRLQVFRHEENKNGAAARNTGIRNAKGDYVAFLDDDDTWKEQKIERQINKLQEKGPSYGACYTWAESRYNDRIEILRSQKEGDITGDVLLMNVDGSFGSTLTVESSIAKSIGGFDEGFDRHQDWEFLIRVLSETQICCVKEPLLIRDQRGGLTDTEVVIESKRKFLSKYSSQIKDTGLVASKKIYARHYLEVAKIAMRNRDYLTGFRYYAKAISNYPFQNTKELAKPPYYFSRMITIGFDNE